MSKHCPKGELTLFDVMGLPVLTNLCLEALQPWRCFPQRVALKVSTDHRFELAMLDSDDSFPWKLHQMGIYDDASAMPEEGKFVYLKDGTFFLAHKAVTHAELPQFARLNQGSATGAGFFHLHARYGLSLHGYSVSLDDLRPSEDERDLFQIVEHLQLTFEPMPGLGTVYRNSEAA